jgi:hypothetical protein
MYKSKQNWLRSTLGLILCAAGLSVAAQRVAAQEDEIVANLAGGRVIIHVTKDAIVFAAIEHPLERKSIPPRIANIDSGHIGILLGAAEWQVPAQPQPIRLDRDLERVHVDQRYQRPGEAEVDLEQIGVQFLEKLRPLVAELRHKIDLKPDEPLFSVVLIGYAPKDYGPEVWVIDYRVEQQSVSASEDYWQTKILRPRFTQLYPPEKHAAHTLIEARFPGDLQDVPLQGLLQQNDPRITRLISSDQRFAKVAELIDHGMAQKAVTDDSADFLRAALPLIAGNANFVEGVMGERGNFQWIVPPTEPVEKRQQTADDKNRPPEAPSLRRRSDLPNR